MEITSRTVLPILAAPLSSLEDFVELFRDDSEDRQLEVVDGQPIVTPSPAGPHQLCVLALGGLLRSLCPAGFVVVPAPWDWVLWEVPRLLVRQPDLVVVTREQAQESRLTEHPLLAVEVVSPGSFERDAVTKRNEYGRAGLEHYWLVEPATPQIAIYRRRGDTLTLERQAIGPESLEIEEPLRVTLPPAQVVG